MKVRFGPAGIGSVKAAEETLEEYKKMGVGAAEIPFTYQIFIKNKQDALRIGKKAKSLGINLSIHAPYWINLNSKEDKKIKESQERILRCCEIGSELGVKKVVFHCGYYGGMEKEETFQNIKKGVQEIQDKINEKGWKVKLAPETMGKINVFGSVEEISRLVKETGCCFCIDFAHILARYKDYNFEMIKRNFPEKEWHCHFSGIEYGESGEKKHRDTKKEEWEKLIRGLKKYAKNKEITIISESPQPIKDSVEGLKVYQND